MEASLIDLLNGEKALVDEINDIDNVLEEIEKRRAELLDKKRTIERKLKSRRSILAAYIDRNLIKYPNHNPDRNPEV